MYAFTGIHGSILLYRKFCWNSDTVKAGAHFIFYAYLFVLIQKQIGENYGNRSYTIFYWRWSFDGCICSFDL